MRAALALVAVLAGCGVKAAPRPPERPGAEPRERQAAAARAARDGGSACAPVDPCFAATKEAP